MEMMEMSQMISTVGFPMFVAMYMLHKGSKDNEKMTDAINKLEHAINVLTTKERA